MKLLVALAVTLLLSALLSAQDEKPLVVGYVEKICVTEIDWLVKAKLDTGATTSSINATIIEQPEPDPSKKEQYVVFAIKTEEGPSAPIRRKISRWVKIKKKTDGYLLRPTVMMEFCIAGKMIEGEVNLANRDHFAYHALVGRNMLTKGRLVVDSSLTFTGEPVLQTKNDKD